MAFLNQCNFFGNIGRDAEMKQSKDGSKSWAEFSIGVSVGSSQSPKTMWVKCLCFGKLGERMMIYATKGSSVYVSGKIDISPYIGKKNNEAMVNIALLCDNVQIMKAAAVVTDNSAPTFDESTPFAAPVFYENLPF